MGLIYGGRKIEDIHSPSLVDHEIITKKGDLIEKAVASFAKSMETPNHQYRGSAE